MIRFLRGRSRAGRDNAVANAAFRLDEVVDILHIGNLRTSLYENYQTFVLRDNGKLSTENGRVWLLMVGAEVVVNPDVYSFRICERPRPRSPALYTTVQAPSLVQFEAWRKAFETVLRGVHITDQYEIEISHPMTVGAHAMLFQGTRLSPQTQVVAKVVPRRFPDDHRSFALTVISRAIRDGLVKSDYLADVLDVYHTANETHVVMPRYGPALHRKLAEGEKMDQHNAKDMFRQLLDALSALHNAGYVHGAVVPSNVLIESERPLRVRLSGSCLACARDPYTNDDTMAPNDRPFQEVQRALSCDAVQYMAPELVRESKGMMSQSADYWALGVLMYRVLIGEEPFLPHRVADESPNLKLDTPLEVMLAYMQFYSDVELLLPKGIKEELETKDLDAISLLALLISPTPNRRDGVAIKQHPWCRSEE